MRTIIAVFCLLAAGAPPLFAQSVPTPEEASAKMGETIRELSSRSPGKALQESIESYQQMVKERQRRDLLPRAAPAPADPGSPFNFGRSASMDPMYRQSLRFNTESVDINLYRPSSRVTLGAGYTERSLSDHGATIYDKTEKYGFIKFQLGGSKDEKKRRIIWLPTATYTETELGPNKVRVDREEHDRGLKELKP
ncbi:MAG: hypothetical protein HY077_14715 [Elusimicrobia bacterium]|nr:hypothetical protein [Elusimicrobiota bacterium]